MLLLITFRCKPDSYAVLENAAAFGVCGLFCNFTPRWKIKCAGCALWNKNAARMSVQTIINN